MELNIGDVVQLKSGGPRMTISFIGEDGLCTCVWFHINEATKEAIRNYPQAILMLCE